MLRNGGHWKDLPKHFPSESTCRRRLHDWTESGLLCEVWSRLVRNPRLLPSLIQLLTSSQQLITNLHLGGTVITDKTLSRHDRRLDDLITQCHSSVRPERAKVPAQLHPVCVTAELIGQWKTVASCWTACSSRRQTARADYPDLAPSNGRQQRQSLVPCRPASARFPAPAATTGACGLQRGAALPPDRQAAPLASRPVEKCSWADAVSNRHRWPTHRPLCTQGSCASWKPKAPQPGSRRSAAANSRWPRPPAENPVTVNIVR